MKKISSTTTFCTRSYSLFKAMRRFFNRQHINETTYRCFGTFNIKLIDLDHAQVDELLSHLTSKLNLVPAAQLAAAA